MKKYVIIGLVLAALASVSCKLDTTEKGGTIEVINDSSYNAYIEIMKGITPVAEAKTANSKGKVTFIIEEDGTYTVNALFYSGQNLPPGGEFTGHGDKVAVLIGGNKETVHVQPSN